MFPQPISELAIRAEMQERQRKYEIDPTLLESYRWFDQPKSIRPNWVRTALWQLGHWFILIGHYLESSATNFTATPTKPLNSA